MYGHIIFNFFFFFFFFWGGGGMLTEVTVSSLCIISICINLNYFPLWFLRLIVPVSGTCLLLLLKNSARL